MKKNMVFVTTTKIGILVAVKTKFSAKDLAKVQNNKERVSKLLTDVHAEIIDIREDSNYNFCIGSYSSGEVSLEALQAEQSNLISAMDQFKDWLKTLPEEDIEELNEEVEEIKEKEIISHILDSTKELINNELGEDARLFMIIRGKLIAGQCGNLHPLCVIHSLGKYANV